MYDSYMGILPWESCLQVSLKLTVAQLIPILVLPIVLSCLLDSVISEVDVAIQEICEIVRL